MHSQAVSACIRESDSNSSAHVRFRETLTPRTLGFSVQVMWMLSAKVSEDIFKKQLERLAGAVVNHLQQLQQGIFTVKPLS